MDAQAHIQPDLEAAQKDVEQVLEEYRLQGMELLQILIPIPRGILDDRAYPLEEELQRTVAEAALHAIREYRSR